MNLSPSFAIPKGYALRFKRLLNLYLGRKKRKEVKINFFNF